MSDHPTLVPTFHLSTLDAPVLSASVVWIGDDNCAASLAANGSPFLDVSGTFAQVEDLFERAIVEVVAARDRRVIAEDPDYTDRADAHEASEEARERVAADLDSIEPF